MARDLIVRIIGDAASLEQSTKSASNAVAGFSTKMDKMREVAGKAGLALGSVLVGGLADSVRLAFDGQVSQAALSQALANTHQSVTAMLPSLEDAANNAAKFGFTSDTAREALAKLEIATGSTSKSISDLGVAENIARFKHIDLASASQMLAQAMTGSTRAVKQLGIEVVPVTSHMDALTASSLKAGDAGYEQAKQAAELADKQATAGKVIQSVTDKVQGQAAAYSDTAAGGLAAFHAQTDNLMESLGTLLLPALETVTSALSTLTDYLSKHKAVAEVVAVVLGTLATALIAVSVAEKLQAAATGIATAAQWLFNTALDANPIVIVTAALVGIGVAIYAFRDKIKDVIEWLADKWTAAWESVRKVVADAVSAVGGILVGAVADLGNTASQVGGSILDAFTSAFDAVRHAVSTLISDITGFFKGLPGAIAGFAESVGSTFVNMIGKGLSALGGVLLSAIKDPINAVIGAWDSIGFNVTLPSIHIPLVGTIGGGHLDFQVPQIPKLDVGGYIAQTGVAIVHRGENVIPAGGMGFGGSGVTVNLTVNGFVGTDQQLARRVADQFNVMSLSTSTGLIRERAIAKGT